MTRFVCLASIFVACSFGSSGPTLKQLEQAQDKVHAMQPAEAATQALVPLLGEPAARSDVAMSWYAPDGEACRELRVELMGDVVGSVKVKKGPCP